MLCKGLLTWQKKKVRWNIGNKKWTTWNKPLDSSRVAISRFSYVFFLLYFHASQSVLSCKVPKRISRKMAVPNATHRNGQEPPLLQWETSPFHIPVSSTSTESTVKLTHVLDCHIIKLDCFQRTCTQLSRPWWIAENAPLQFSFRTQGPKLRIQRFPYVYSTIAWYCMHHFFSRWIDLDFKSGFWMMSLY